MLAGQNRSILHFNVPEMSLEHNIERPIIRAQVFEQVIFWEIFEYLRH